VAGDEGSGRANPGIGDGDSMSLGEDVRGETSENVAGRQLDEEPETELEEQGGGVVPADRPLDAPGKVVTYLLGVAQRAAADVAHVRDGRRVHPNTGESALELGRDRGHEGRVRGSGNGEAPGVAGAVLASEDQDPIQDLIRAGDADLQRRVDVCRVDRRFRRPGLGGETGHRPLVQPDNDTHAVSVRPFRTRCRG
jgi:hypothetical protein